MPYCEKIEGITLEACSPLILIEARNASEFGVIKQAITQIVISNCEPELSIYN